MVIADTGFWVALGNPRDEHHERAVAVGAEIAGEPLVTTWPVLVETCHLLVTRMGALAQERYLKGHAAGAFEIVETSIHPVDRMLELMERYRTLPMDAADASLVLLAKHLGHGRILSTDRRDFRTYRWKSRRPFENLLLPD